jgi:hypothetical protein
MELNISRVAYVFAWRYQLFALLTIFASMKQPRSPWSIVSFDVGGGASVAVCVALRFYGLASKIPVIEY